MKRIYIIVCTLCALIFLHPSVVMGQNVFEGVVSFDKVEHNFGDILISSGPKECTFTFKNVGSAPIAVHRVTSSCGCTEPTWTQYPVKSGESGQINVTFNNDQGPYPFNKTLTVYISGLSKPVLLKIKGVAHEKKKTIGELFPIHYGPVGIKESRVSFGQIEQGATRSIELEFANLTSKTQEVSFSNLTSGLSLSTTRTSIAPNSIVKVICTINTSSMQSQKWGKTPFTFSMMAGGKNYKNVLTVEALIKENFSNLTEQQKRSASFPQFESSSIDFGLVSAGEILEGEFFVKNIGREPFEIYKIDLSENGGNVTLPGIIEPAANGVIKVNIDTAGQSGEMMNILTLITNSPTRPIINLFVIYTVR